MTTREEKAHLEAMAGLGCIAGHCGRPAECHHIRQGAGMGRKNSHFEVIPLCESHHRTGGFGIAIHAGKKTWESKYGSERELLAQTLALLVKK